MEKYVSIGFTKKCHGVKGELKIKIEDYYLEDFLKVPVLFLLIKGKHVPHFIEKIKHENELLLKLEEIDAKETAQPLTSKEIFIQPKYILKKEERKVVVESDLVFAKFIGYTIIDSELGEIGKIEKIEEFPQQEMAIVIYNKNEVFIPLHENLIEKTEEPQQYIYMNLPEGLLEL